MKRITIYGLLLISLFLYSCSKVRIEIEFPYSPTNPDSTNSSNSSSDSALVNFFANVEGLNLSRSMTPIQLDVLATIYAYNADTTSLVASGNYESSSLGTLTGVNDYKMYLTKGTYSFFSVSTNSDVSVPTFSDFTSVPLKNGIDYLWWNMDNSTIGTPAAINLNIIYTHVACQVVFSISEGTGIVIDSLSTISTTAPTEGNTMNLKTGKITPSSTRQSGFVNKMGLNGLVAQSILLPAINWNFMGIVINAFINGDETEKQFVAQVPIQQSKLEGGYSYQYSLILTPDSITTGTVEISEWTIVKDNIPIYPSEL